MQADESKIEENVDRLCADLTGRPLTAERAAALENLLIDRPALQDKYCWHALLNTLLWAEFGEPDGPSAAVHPLTRPVSRERECEVSGSLTATRPGTLATASLSRRPGKRRWVTWATAATIAGVFITAASVFYAVNSSRWNGVPTATSKAAPATTNRVYAPRAIDLLHRVTYTVGRQPSDERSARNDSIRARIVQGAARMLPFNGQDAGGYIIKIPPRHIAELSVFADAEGENVLALMELDQYGQPTGEVTSFSNRPAGTEDRATPIFGPLGVRVERNDTQRDKYYLLTGLQRAAKGLGEATWVVADYSLTLELPGLIQIGWDDTGWTEYTEDKNSRDKDFNDLIATLRITRGDSFESVRDALPATVPEIDEPAEYYQPRDDDNGFAIQVPPSQGVILNVACNAARHHEFILKERESGRVWWRRNNEGGLAPFLGAFVINNTAAEPISLVVAGRFRPAQFAAEDGTGETGWVDSPHRVLVYGGRCQSIGFEDDGGDEDWNDLRVNFHWLDD